MSAEVKAGVKVLDLCARGDKFIEECVLCLSGACSRRSFLTVPSPPPGRETAKSFNKKTKDGAKVEKGLAFPTCVSLNQYVPQKALPPLRSPHAAPQLRVPLVQRGGRYDGGVRG